jgi:hypothetical protein
MPIIACDETTRLSHDFPRRTALVDALNKSMPPLDLV